MVKDINSLVGKGIYPILDNSQAILMEKELLQSSESEWMAMKEVGYKTSTEVLRDFQELMPIPENMTVLVLCGKGKNGGDSLLVADYIMRTMPRSRVVVLATDARDELHPLTQKALEEVKERVSLYEWTKESEESLLDQLIKNEYGYTGRINICIDGLLGSGFMPPLKETHSEIVSLVNNNEKIDLRISVDLPTGLCEYEVEDELYFKSDFCYITAIPKRAVFKYLSGISRIRFIDIGLLEQADYLQDIQEQYLLSSRCLNIYKVLRPVNSEKRSFGHLFIIGGSVSMPGALLMSVKAALKSGVGLVTALAPGSIIPFLSAQVPEAMWVPLPETSFGTIGAQASEVILSNVNRATAIVAGPGLGLSRDTEMVIQEILQKTNVPILLDADALVPRVLEIIQKGKHNSKKIILTPHLGEFFRMTKLIDFDFSPKNFIDIVKNIGATIVLKGSITRICDGEKIYINTRGGPVFSRAGSGDILAGIIGAQLSQNQFSVQLAPAFRCSYARNSRRVFSKK